MHQNGVGVIRSPSRWRLSCIRASSDVPAVTSACACSRRRSARSWSAAAEAHIVIRATTENRPATASDPPSL